MAPSGDTTPLPLAANRAALSNRISLLLSSQSSVLKTMNLSRPSPSTTANSRRTLPPEADDDDILKGTRPNEGVGYVADKKTAPVRNAREDRMLRGGLRGKNGKAEGKGKGKWKEESESEDEVGRSALGKRKRPKREVQPELEAEVEAERQVQIEEVNGEKKAEDDAEDVRMEESHVEAAENTGDEKETGDVDPGEKKKRKRKKKKNKNKNKNKETQVEA